MERVPLDIVFYAPGMPFDGDTIKQKSLGGSETAALEMARHLAKLGNRVTMFSNCPHEGRNFDGVLYHNANKWRHYASANTHDVCIVQRDFTAVVQPIQSRYTVLWCHDLALGRQAMPFKGALWNVDKVAVVSEYMRDQYKLVYGLPDYGLWTTRNGINLEDFSKFAGKKRDKNKLMYCARPERGLDLLLVSIFPKLLEKNPDYTLYIAAYDNTVPEMRPFYDSLAAEARRFGDRVKVLGALAKRELYLHYATAGMYLYPTPSPTSATFREVSCISAMECMASGLPFVTTAIGALPETLGGAGVLTEGHDPADPMQQGEYCKKFVESVERLRTDEAFWNEKSEAGKARAASFTWNDAAKDWDSHFRESIKKNNDNADRLARHFIKRSDIMAAVEVLKESSTPDANEMRGLIAKHFGDLLQGQEKYTAHYEKIGKGHSDAFHATAQEPRLHQAHAWLESNKQVKRLLDFGCAHGSYAVHLSNTTDVEIVGIDHDKYSIEWAEKNKADPKRCLKQDKVRFLLGDETGAVLDKEIQEHGKFDAAFLFEVLEHVTEPWSLIDHVEKQVTPGGKILVSVPFGPWEYMSYDSYPHRCHLWEYDIHDLHDMLKEKDKLMVHTMMYGVCEQLNAPVGWYIIEWQVNDKQTHKIDMERKLWLQRPKETISAVIIAGPNSEESLHWSLRSLRYVADEIIIGDCGMNEEAKRIALSNAWWMCPITIVPASDPKVAGFETPRNEMLKLARYDWIIWIDTDEKILDPGNIHKYTRKNIFDGYSIKQHHFAVDTHFNADLPVRLFRRVTNDGKPMQWYGMIHEHPERAMNDGPGITVCLADVDIAHIGYLKEGGRRVKFSRNRPLLDRDIEKYPNRLIQKHFIMRDKMTECRYELSQNGGVVTPAIRGKCEETVAIWREHFKGKQTYMGADSLQYYSMANEILNRGFSGMFEVTADKYDAKPNGGPMKVRWASKDDFETEVSAKVRTISEPYESVHY